MCKLGFTSFDFIQFINWSINSVCKTNQKFSDIIQNIKHSLECIVFLIS